MRHYVINSNMKKILMMMLCQVFIVLPQDEQSGTLTPDAQVQHRVEQGLKTDLYGVFAVSYLASVVSVSVLQGIYNIRRYQQVIAQLELDYNLSTPVYFKDYPSELLQSIICSSLPALDMTHQKKHGLAVSEITQKIGLFEVMNPNIIWDFELFKGAIPHMGSGGGSHVGASSGYSISKSYLGSFGYSTLGLLKNAINYQIVKVENDFKVLLQLTDLACDHPQISRTLKEFAEFDMVLNRLSDNYGAYTFLGACGYSTIHNGSKIKGYLKSLTKMHAFLYNFQQLLINCTDSDDTYLIHAQGVLHFSVQQNLSQPQANINPKIQ